MDENENEKGFDGPTKKWHVFWKIWVVREVDVARTKIYEFT
jgi:hypothetical protein